MSHLQQYVNDKRVFPFAMVYVNACGGKGLEIFMREMSDMGVDLDAMRERRHFVLNHAKTGALRPYTGEVWILRDPSPDMLREIAPMLAERDSRPLYNDDADLHVYNNPLFRESVRMGAWGRIALTQRPVIKPVNPALPTRMVTRLILEACQPAPVGAVAA